MLVKQRCTILLKGVFVARLRERAENLGTDHPILLQDSAVCNASDCCQRSINRVCCLGERGERYVGPCFSYSVCSTKLCVSEMYREGRRATWIRLRELAGMWYSRNLGLIKESNSVLKKPTLGPLRARPHFYTIQRSRK